MWLGIVMVSWNLCGCCCDSLYGLQSLAIHGVDKTHAGTTDSSVMYIPASPLTEANARYLVRQRETFFEGK